MRARGTGSECARRLDRSITLYDPPAHRLVSFRIRQEYFLAKTRVWLWPKSNYLTKTTRLNCRLGLAEKLQGRIATTMAHQLNIRTGCGSIRMQP